MSRDGSKKKKKRDAGKCQSGPKHLLRRKRWRCRDCKELNDPENLGQCTSCGRERYRHGTTPRYPVIDPKSGESNAIHTTWTDIEASIISRQQQQQLHQQKQNAPTPTPTPITWAQVEANIKRKKQEEEPALAVAPSCEHEKRKKKTRKKRKMRRGSGDEAKTSSRKTDASSKSRPDSKLPPDFVGFDDGLSLDLTATLENVLYTGSVSKASFMKCNALHSHLHYQQRCRDAEPAESLTTTTFTSAASEPSNTKTHDLNAPEGVWPSIPSSIIANGLDASKTYCAKSDETWETTFGYGPKEPPTDEKEVLRSLVDRCWHRAVHTASSVLQCNPLEDLNGSRSLHGNALSLNDSTCTNPASVNTIGMLWGTANVWGKDKDIVQSILERESTFIIDSLLHVALMGGKNIAKIRVAGAKGVTHCSLDWMAFLRLLMTSVESDPHPNLPHVISSQESLIQSFAHTIQVRPGMPPIPLNDQSLKNIIMRLSEISDEKA